MTGLVLSGGGTAGAYQAGVLYGLFDRGLEVDHIYGVSIGSINSAILSFQGYKALYHYWCEQRWTAFDFFRPTFTGWFLRGGFCSMKPMSRNIDEIFEGKLSTPFTVASVHLETNSIVNICSETATREELKRGILASAALPMICEPVDNRVDGAVKDNANVKYALTQGHDEIVVVSCNPMEVQPIQAKERLSVFDVGKRAIYEMMLTEYFREDLSDCPDVDVRVYSPMEKQRILNFRSSNLRKQFELGFEDSQFMPRLLMQGKSKNLVSSLRELKDGR